METQNPADAAGTRRLAEDALHFSQFVVEHMADAAFYITPDGLIAYVNPAACRLLGYDQSELLGKPLAGIDVGILQAQDWARHWEELKRAGTLLFESRHKTKGGAVIPVEIRANHVTLGGREYDCGFVRDITERKQAEAALRESRRTLSTLMNNLPGMAYRCRNERDWPMEFVSEGAFALTGYTAEELTASARISYAQVIHPGDRERIWEETQEAVRLRQPYQQTYRIVTASGGEKWVWEQGCCVFSEQGEPLALEGFISDITERRQTEEALRAAQQRLQSIVEFLPDPTFVLDRDKKVIAWNRACEALTGVPKASILGKGDYAYAEPFVGRRCPVLIDQMDLPGLDLDPDRYQNIRRIGDTITAEAFNTRLQGGRGIHLWGTAAPLYDPDGRRCGAIQVVRDVTDQRRVEQALHESEFKYRMLFEMANDAILLMHRQHLVDCNARALALFGCSREELLGAHGGTFSPSVQPDGRRSAEKALEWFRRALEEGPQSFEWEYRRKDGTPFTAEVSLNRLDLGGEILLQAIVRDITVRKQTEEALRQSEATIRSVFDAAPVGICIMKDRAYQSANKYWCEKFGHPEETLIGRSTRMLYETEEEWNRVGRELYDHLGEVGQASVETRLRRGDDSFRQVVVTAALLRPGDPSAGTVAIIHDITERKLAEDALRESEGRFTAFMANLPAAAFVKDERGLTVFANHYLQRLLGWGDWRGRPTAELVGGEAGLRMAEDDRRALAEGPLKVLEEVVDGAGIQHAFETIKFPIRVEGKPAWLGGISVDITDRRRAEQEKEALQAQLLQAQKLESVGRLAGGVAHDFNNMLGVIMGHAELCLMNADENHPFRGDLLEIHQAAERSANLTRQLLAFARKQAIMPRVLDLNATVEGMLKMLRRLIGEDIELGWQPKAGLWPVRVDPSQIDQVLANLCVNARDAITGPGRISIETSNSVVGGAYAASCRDAVPGDYVVLSVDDSGSGMGPDVLSHLFEPFFTTKELGRGTGLGLATVYGIVRQNNGFIDVQSEPGRGSVFRIHLPRHADAEGREKPEAPPPPDRGTETILLVEDEPANLRTCTRMLESLGYAVLAAGTADDAVRFAREHAGGIDLLLTDVVMPGAGGGMLAGRLRALVPGLRCLFMSGYTADEITQHSVLPDDVHFIQKPFSTTVLASSLRRVLAGG